MTTIVLARGLILVLTALAVGVPVAAEPEQRRSSSFHGITSRKKAEPEPLPTARYTQLKKRRDDRKAICLDTRFRAASAASELAERAQNLHECAQMHDLSVGCSFEFGRLRTAHDSYESALISAGGCG